MTIWPFARRAAAPEGPPEAAGPAWTWRKSSQPTPHVTQNRMDLTLLATVGLLLVVGLMAVFSSSFVFALDDYNDPAYFFWRQARWVLIGGAALPETADLARRVRQALDVIGSVQARKIRFRTLPA